MQNAECCFILHSAFCIVHYFALYILKIKFVVADRNQPLLA